MRGPTMSDDDLLRSILEHEARLVPMRHDAHDALAALEPALRRATFKRTSLIAASTVLVLGGTVAAFNVVRPTDDEISIVSPVTATTEPQSTIGTGETLDDDGVPTSLDDDSTIHSPIEISDDDGPEHSVPPSAPPTSAAPTTATAPFTTDRSGGGAGPTPPAPTPAPTAPAVTTSTSPTTPVPAPATTAPAGQELTRYDSTCGSVLADLAPSPPTIVEVVVASGYRYRIEEPDGNSITVQFTGPGEDCEVKVGPHDDADDADHAERSESEDSSGDDSSTG